MPNDANGHKMSNASNTPNDSEDASTPLPEATPKRKPRQPKPGTETFQLLDFPSGLLSKVNNTAGYLEISRLDFVVRILEAVLNEMEVPKLQTKLKNNWDSWQKQHPLEISNSAKKE